MGNFTVEQSPIDPDIAVVDYGNGTVVVVVPEDATGNVTITVDGKEYTADVVNGTAVIQLDDVTPGTHDVEVFYSGDDKYSNATKEATITAPKYDSPVSIEVSEIKSGENGTITVTLPENATGNVTVWVDGRNYTAEVHDGVAVVEVGNLTAGNKTFVVEYSGDDNYESAYVVGNFTVEQSPIAPDVSVVDYGNGTVVVVVPEDATGNVTITVDGKDYTADVVNGTAVVQLDDVTPGTHVAEVFYSGDDKYTNATVNVNVTAPKHDADITVDVGEIMSGEDGTITVTLPSDATGNVTVLVDGKEFSAEVHDGVAVVEVGNLTAGNKTVVVEYTGDDNYDSKIVVGNFTVEQSPIAPDVTVVDYGNGTVMVIVPEDAQGNVTVKVGDRQFNATVENGKAVVQLDGIAPGTHVAEVFYSGDDKYTNATVKANVTAPKYSTPVSVDVSEIKSGENGTITVILPENATGNVTVSVDGKEFSAEVHDGVAVVEVGNLTAGPKTFVVEYSGDDNYESTYVVGNFTVEQSPIDPDVTVVDYGNGTVVVVVPEDATGNVTITVDSKEYTAEVVNGTAVVQLDDIAPGEHEVEVVYSGDDKYANATKYVTITAPKYDAPVSINVSEIKSGENGTITVTLPENATGNVTVTVDGREYSAEVVNGTAIVNVGNLTAGNKTVVVEYSGDDNYDSKIVVGNFTVEQSPITPGIAVVDNGNGTIVVVVPEDATGNVTITVDGREYTAEVVNGTAVIQLDDAAPGTHDVEVVYSGDDKYTNATVNVNVTAPKYDSPITVDAGEIMSGENGTITVTLPEGATGNVTVSVDGREYTAEVVNGTAVVRVDNLTAGPKTVVVEYSGDDNFAPGYEVANFTVEQSPVTPDVTVVDSGNGTVVVVVPEDATGNVTVTVDGKEYTAAVENGKAIIQLDDAAPGEHDVEVVYSGDGKYANATVSDKITAPKYDSPISLDIGEIVSGEDGTITVTLPEGATGNVTVSVDGREYVAEVVNGTAVVKVDNLTAGPKTLVVEYSGDDNFAPSYEVANFTVDQSKVTPDSPVVVDQGNGTIVVVVPEDATGNVTVTVDGREYTAEVVNGTAVIQLDGVAPGEHDVQVAYSGDDKYTGANATARVTAPKLATPIEVTAQNIHVGDRAIITVTLPEGAAGEVSIEIDGVKYTSQVQDGRATFEIEGLIAGTKTIAAEYAGDDNYVANHTTGDITVSKSPSSVSAQITDIDVGENVTITVSVPEDATGQVLIDIDGVGYYVNVTGGTGSAQIPRMPDGIYNVNLTYTGDDKYLPSSNTASFNVSKVPSFVIPTAQDIFVGEVEEITLTVPADATGTVTVIIDGEAYDFSLNEGTLTKASGSGEVYSVAVSGGNGILTITGLPRGEYVVSVRYNGDAKYLPATNTTVFKVIKSNTTIAPIDLDNGTVIIELPENATGTVTINVDGDTYTAEVVNGTAVVDLSNLTPGKHFVEVVYSGDAEHDAQKINTTVSIPKYHTPIGVEIDDIEVGDTAVVTVSVPEDATGNVTIEVEGVTYTAEIRDGKAVFHVKGLPAGSKGVVVQYVGDEYYGENFTSSQFNVTKKDSSISASSKNIKVGNDEVITVTVPSDATGRILVKINGIGYYADIANGKAKVIVPQLPAGKYTATIYYDGDGKYKESEPVETTFTVSKSKAPISASTQDIVVGDDGTVTVNLPSDATGTVTITVNGKSYTARVRNGQAVFVVPGLTPGSHKITVAYSGDAKYDANVTKTGIEVHDNENPAPHDDVNEAGEKAGLEVHETGNPILIFLLVLLAVGTTQIKRFRK